MFKRRLFKYVYLWTAAMDRITEATREISKSAINIIDQIDEIHNATTMGKIED